MLNKNSLAVKNVRPIKSSTHTHTHTHTCKHTHTTHTNTRTHTCKHTHANTHIQHTYNTHTSRLTIVSREAKKKQPYATNE